MASSIAAKRKGDDLDDEERGATGTGVGAADADGDDDMAGLYVPLKMRRRLAAGLSARQRDEDVRGFPWCFSIGSL